MKKVFLFVLLIIPFVVAAQTDPPLFKDFAKNIKGTTSTLAFDDHLNVMQLNIDNSNFIVVAVNDQMQIVWTTTLAGSPFCIAKFKGEIIAIASTDYSANRGPNNIYKAFLIDPLNGKTIIEKVIYEGTPDYTDFPTVLKENGNFRGISVRQSTVKRNFYVAAPAITNKVIAHQFNQTQNVDIILLNDKLEPTFSFKPQITSSSLLQTFINKQGDIFLSWLDGGHIEVQKYAFGQKVISSKIVSDVSFSDEGKVSDNIDNFLASSVDDNVVYFSIIYLNEAKKPELGIGSFDFSTGKKQYYTEAFDGEHIKNIKKGFVPINKKFEDADLGNPKYMGIRSFEEVNGTIIVVMSSQIFGSTANAMFVEERALLINLYDSKLGLKNQQILPSSSLSLSTPLSVGLNVQNNKLYVVANNKHGYRALNGMFGSIDLSTGKWEKLEELSKKKMDSYDYADATAILWFGHTFIVPYNSTKGFFQNKVDITLQQNTY